MGLLNRVRNYIENHAMYIGPESHPKALGARLPEDKPYAEKYPLRTLLAEPRATIPRVPLVLGVNWYTNFDSPVPVQFGEITRYFIGRTSNLGSIRGGHAICAKVGHLSDPLGWWDFYNQGREGACVGYAGSRMMSLLNRERYFAKWLWDWCKLNDFWADTNPGDANGTSVDTMGQILSRKGHVIWRLEYKPLDENSQYVARDALPPDLGRGLTTYRWAASVDEVRTVLQSPLNDRLQAIPFLNSWGRFYPHITWMPYTVLERLIRENGDVLVPTDR